MRAVVRRSTVPAGTAGARSAAPAGTAGRAGPSGRRLDWTDDRGAAGGIESVPFGILVFVMGTLMVVNLWAVIDTKMALNAAAREHVHAMAESADGDEAVQVGAEAGRSVVEVWGRDPARLTTESVTFLDGTGAPTVWRRCARIVVTLRYDVSLINLPMIGAAYGPEPIAIRATRTELVDPFRDTAEALGDC